MKVLTLFLPLFLWTETSRASVIKQDEPFMELKIDSADGPILTRHQDSIFAEEEEEGKPLNEIDFYNAKSININTSRPKDEADGSLSVKAGLFEGAFGGIFDLISNKVKGAFNPRWPNAIVPYVISSDFDNAMRTLIARAFLEYHAKTCIRFEPKTSADRDYVNFEIGEGCYSRFGHTRGAQVLSLGKGCEQFKTILHELMHAIGFEHEQSRPDRDDYISIEWDNVQTGMEDAFEKSNWPHLEKLNVPYDYDSIMHYDAYAFAKDVTQPTIIPKQKGKMKIIGRVRSFSEIDLKKIKKLYKCEMNGANRIDDDCKDREGWCAEYAERGDCDKYSVWMKTTCMKACGVCGGGCKDHSSHCAKWSGEGLCEKNPVYMKAFCQKTCKEKVEEEAGEPLNEIEFYNSKTINASDSNNKVRGSLTLKAGFLEGAIDGIFDVLGNSSMLPRSPQWPNASIPYVIAKSFDNETRTLIARVMLEYHTRTCIRFVPKTSTDKDYINIMKGDGCHAYVGRVGGAQEVTLGENCYYFKVIAHELMHAVGFQHEQSRPDRDDYVTIAWDNVQKGQEYAFKKFDWKQMKDLGEPYDFNSIMHYNPYNFAVDVDKPTITSKKKGKVIGHADSFSDTDLRKIKKLYKCSMNGKNRIAENCADGEGWCAEYAKRGDCDKYSAWMKTTCMKACGMCGGGCKDHSSHCAKWSGEGLCEKNPSYMKAFCKKSCKHCT